MGRYLKKVYEPLAVTLTFLIFWPVLEGKYQAKREVSLLQKMLSLLKMPILVIGSITILRAKIVFIQGTNITDWQRGIFTQAWQITTVITFYDIILFICLYAVEMISMVYSLRYGRAQYQQ